MFDTRPSILGISQSGATLHSLLEPGWHKIDPVNDTERIYVKEVFIAPSSFTPDEVAQSIRNKVDLSGHPLQPSFISTSCWTFRRSLTACGRSPATSTRFSPRNSFSVAISSRPPPTSIPPKRVLLPSPSALAINPGIRISSVTARGVLSRDDEKSAPRLLREVVGRI